jgi:glycine cleavage system aminomethyltransferase T
VLKKMIALATVESSYAREGGSVQIEMTIEAIRHRVTATVVPTPFFNPSRKVAIPPA